MQHHPDEDVADDEDGDIGRQVVGAVMVQLLATGGTGIADLEVGAEQLAVAAARAAAAGAPADGAPERARFAPGSQFDTHLSVSPGFWRPDAAAAPALQMDACRGLSQMTVCRGCPRRAVRSAGRRPPVPPPVTGRLRYRRC